MLILMMDSEEDGMGHNYENVNSGMVVVFWETFGSDLTWLPLY
jgi:hypothetical protein